MRTTWVVLDLITCREDALKSASLYQWGKTIRNDKDVYVLFIRKGERAIYMLHGNSLHLERGR